jgi:hypothetical protein
MKEVGQYGGTGRLVIGRQEKKKQKTHFILSGR